MEAETKRKIIKASGNTFQEVSDTIAVEKGLRVLVNGQEALRLRCSPLMVRELVVGLLMTEGIIEGEVCFERMSIEYGEEITVDIPAEGQVKSGGGTLTSGCLGGVTFPERYKARLAGTSFFITAPELCDLFKRFQAASALYRATGCIHSAAVSDGRELLFLAEDIGRHNAVDKVIGCCLLEETTLEDKVVLVSGRLSSEMAHKCSRWGVPVVASRAAPTDMALDMARQCGTTMVGFLRGQRFNIYTHPERILPAGDGLRTEGPQEG